MKVHWRLFVLIAGGYLLLIFGHSLAEPQNTTLTAARCQIVVPASWGEFVGGSNYGLAFRDDQGTIRLMNQMPCGLEGKPNVSLEIKRQ
ncbi:MAG TPA: hypothetical protein VGG46_11560 [Terriglobales bacterium]|jgi:hypothetical protein